MLDVIWRRRSVREYTDEPVPGDVIEELIRAGMQAPSARNLQPWHFVVTTEKGILAQVPEHHPYGKMVPGAAAVILVCGDTSIQENPGYLAQDCSAATQNILLEAAGQGLGAVWLGVYPRPPRILGMRKLFSLPGYILPVSLISIGYPSTPPGEVDRFIPDRIHRDVW